MNESLIAHALYGQQHVNIHDGCWQFAKPSPHAQIIGSLILTFTVFYLKCWLIRIYIFEKKHLSVVLISSLRRFSGAQVSPPIRKEEADWFLGGQIEIKQQQIKLILGKHSETKSWKAGWTVQVGRAWCDSLVMTSQNHRNPNGFF